MEKPQTHLTVSEKLRRKVGRVIGQGHDPETGRSNAEERMIRIMQERGGGGFRILRSAEVTPKNYKRSSE